MRPHLTALAVCVFLFPSQNIAPAAPVPAKADKIKELQKEHLATVTRIYELTLERYKSGHASPDQLLQSQAAILSAKLELAQTKQERIKAHEEMVRLAEQAQEHAQKLADAGQGTTSDALKAKAYLLRARIALEKAKSDR